VSPVKIKFSLSTQNPDVDTLLIAFFASLGVTFAGMATGLSFPTACNFEFSDFQELITLF
jgi:hypothetical protein